MQLSDMRDKLRKRIGNPSVTDVPDADLTALLNIAYRQIADNYRFHTTRTLYSFNTVADTRGYALPAGCAYIIHVRNTNENTDQPRLEKLDDKRAAALLDVVTTGVPIQYIRYGDTLYLQPTPDDVYAMEVFYKADITDLVNDADVPIFPAAWHIGVIHLAVFNYYLDEGDEPKANSAQNVYDLWAQRKTNEVDEEKRDFDSGVNIPTLGGWNEPRLDFNHSD